MPDPSVPDPSVPHPTDLAAALRGVLGSVTVEGLARLPGGASRETWAFDAIAADGTRSQMVLRRDPPGRPGEPGWTNREARAMDLARDAGLPVPELLTASASAPGPAPTHGPALTPGLRPTPSLTPAPGPAPTPGLIMRRVPGQTIARRILRDSEYAAARRALVGELGRFAARLHAIDPPDDFPVPDPLASLRERLEALERDLGQVSEVFAMALRRLEDDRPPDRGPVIVHGDFRLGNLIVGPRSLRAVIDWELVHLGNPAEDLGWLCVKAWRFGVDAPVAGLGSREELLAAYTAAGGADISLDELRWWEVLGTLRWGVICMQQTWVHLSGAQRSVELAAIGRRVCEQEWDLLLLLAPEDAAAAAAATRSKPVASAAGPPAPEPAPYGRPTAGELVQAVRAFITEQVMPTADGQLAFHSRVAGNVLDIVARELAAGAPPDGQNLARAVAARLAIANPRYFDVLPQAPVLDLPRHCARDIVLAGAVRRRDSRGSQPEVGCVVQFAGSGPSRRR